MEEGIKILVALALVYSRIRWLRDTVDREEDDENHAWEHCAKDDKYALRNEPETRVMSEGDQAPVSESESKPRACDGQRDVLPQ